MKKTFHLFTCMLCMLALFSCEKNSPTSDPTLIISPSTAVAFSAAATESFSIEVNTNQASWDVVSSQTWCKVAKNGNSFTITATPNSSTTAPTAATITVSAGKAQSVTISATQSGTNVTLTATPSTPINFSAAATESIEIVVATNQNSWEAVSDQSWCVVTKSADRFTVTATPNTLTTAPAPANITVTAPNAANITIGVTQDAATTASYPTTVADLAAAIKKTWVFPTNSDYMSLEFEAGSTYTLMSPNPSDDNTYLIMGSYTIDPDLHTITLSDFGTVYINTLTDGQSEFIVTPTNRDPFTVQATKQVVAPAVPSTNEKIKRVWFTDATSDVEYDFTYQAGNLSVLVMSQIDIGGRSTVTSNITHQSDKVTISSNLPDGINGVKINITCVYQLENGLATSMTQSINGINTESYKYKYNSSRQLIATINYGQDGIIESYASATWANGNINNIYLWEASQPANKTTYYSYDMSKPNKGGFISPNLMPRIFIDEISHFGYYAGVFGQPSANLVTCFGSGIFPGKTFTYSYNGEGYPTLLTIQDKIDPTPLIINFSFE